MTTLRDRLRAAARDELPDELRDVPEPVIRHFVNLGGYEIAAFLRRLVPTGGRVLVIGVGAGRDYYALGTDHEVVALDLVAQSTVPDVVLADFSKEIPLPDGSVDAVVIVDVIEHVFDDLHALEECHRVLTPHGSLILNVPYGDDIGDHHVRVYTRATARRLLEAAGFTVAEEVERGPLAHLDRYLPWRAAFHGWHLLRLLVTGRAGYSRSLERLVAVDWFFGTRRISPGRWSKRHGAYLRAVKAERRDFTEVNRLLYRDQGDAQLARD